MGQKFINALLAAARRGVSVRVVIDGVGSADDAEVIASNFYSHGIDSRIYHPLPWQVYHYRWAIKQGEIFGRLIYFFQKINHRDHRKLCVIDKKILWTGSLNISSQHLSVEGGGKGWRIWINSAYFSPSSTFIKSMKQACLRGVEVRLVVPSQSDVFLFPSLTASYYDELIHAGVVVFEYSSAFLHGKALIIDDFFLVGSTNFNHRSFLHDLELDISLNTQKAQNSLEKQFVIYTNKAVKITPQHLKRRSWEFVIGWIPRLLRYWM